MTEDPTLFRSCVLSPFKCALFVAWLSVILTAASAFVGSGEPVQKQRREVLRPRVGYVEEEKASMVTVVVPNAPGLGCELWCYEDQLGKAEAFHQEGDRLVLTHRLNQAVVVSRFVPHDDGLELMVEVSGPTAEAVRSVGSLNPCYQFRRSEAFKNQGDYVDDFVSRCFVFLEGGLTRLNDTRRVPGTRRKISKANLPEPWIQEYFPIWRKHPGQIPGRRGYSLDRPVAPIIGCVSRDGRYLAAIAWPEARSLGQVWHDCLHPRPAIGESYDGRRNRIVSRGRIYFLPNDEAALRSAFRRDFPDWRRPHPE